MSKAVPESSLRLSWVYGYRGHQCRSNCHFNEEGNVVYFVAATGIVYSRQSQKQSFYLHHNDDILCLSMHPNKRLVASGETGKSPSVCIWDSTTMKTISVLKKEGTHTHGVGSVSFSPCGGRVLSVGIDPKSLVAIWEWENARQLCVVNGHTDRIFDSCFLPNSDASFVTVGVKHIKVWNVMGNTLKSQRGIFGEKGALQTVLCCCRENETGRVLTGTMDGSIYAWNGNELEVALASIAPGPIYSIISHEEGYVAAGKFGYILMLNNDLESVVELSLGDFDEGLASSYIRSVSIAGGSELLIATAQSEVVLINIEDESLTWITRAHAEGELWGLGVHPTEPLAVTASDDKSFRIWNLETHETVSVGYLETEARSCCFSPDGASVAVGMKTGQVQIFNVEDMSELVKISDRKQARHCCAYSPSGEFLAVGSNDNRVDIYAAGDEYSRVGVGTKASSFITQVDWSAASDFVAACDGAGERLVYDTAGDHITDSDVLAEIQWATVSGVVGEEVDGVFPKYSNITDVNSVAARSARDLLATGDDFGLVKLFRFPASRRGAKFRKYNGHSAHVTNVCWSGDGSYLLSIGGGDHGLFQWKLYDAETAEGDEGDDADDDDDDLASNSGIDSNSEESDSSDPDRDVDSDLEREMEENYARDLYKDDLVKLKSEVDKTGYAQKRPAAPENSLTLKWCAGYRGHDCRENVKYAQSGEVVFHSAALGVVYNRENHTQRFYTAHSDDLLCLTIHPTKDIVASGQIGREPEIHVWDVAELNTISIFKGVHERGICAVEFTSDGKRLLSVGLSDNHCVAVWDWRRGECVSQVNGSKDKVFCVLSNPMDSSLFVTTGVKHIKFWKIVGATSEGKRGITGDNGDTTSHLCGAFGQEEGTFFSGGANGKIYCWAGNRLSRTIDAHTGPCFTICSLEEGFISGGKDGMIVLWNIDCTEKMREYEIKVENISEESHGTLLADCPPIRTIVMGHGALLAGSKNGEIMEIDREGPIKVLAQGHGPGELWGLATHPTDPVAATYSDDGSIRIWNLEEYKMTLAKDFGKPGRCMTYSPDGTVLAAGQKDGTLLVLQAEDLELIKEFKHRKQNISDMKFDPFGRFLAVASHENCVDVYSIQKQKRIGICRGASSYITHVDWTRDGKLIQINSGASERLFYEIPSCKRVTPDKANVAKLDWDRWTSVLGPEVEGIWPPYTDVTDINTATATADASVVATGDDFGFIKLFAFPSKEKHAKCKKYVGHSSHVTKVRFAVEDSILVSTGGGDASIMIWERPNEQVALDSGDEDSDDDDDFFDSDVEEELRIDYTRQTNQDNERERRRQNGPDGDEETAPALTKVPFVRGGTDANFMAGFDGDATESVTALELGHVFGYRGYDARANVDFLLSATGPAADGLSAVSKVIYHAAGIGVVHDFKGNEQFFYTGHSDDILCLNQNKHPNYRAVIATGQLGGSVHVWSVNEEENKCDTLSIISGLPGGVSSVSFSGSGKLLLTGCLDQEHTVSVYRWQTGQFVASKCSGPKKIFQAAFRPDSDSKFVTVGEKSLFFWQIAGSVLLCKKAQPGSLTLSQVGTCLSLAFGTDDVTFTGMATGSVIVWNGSTATRLIEKAHNGPVFTMFTTLKDGLIVTGGKEKSQTGAVKLWDSQMKKCKTFTVPIENDSKKGLTVKAVSRVKGKIALGTKDNAVAIINEKSNSVETVTLGHVSIGRVNCVTAHPTQSGIVLSGSSDCTARVWDCNSKTLVTKIKFEAAVTAACYLNINERIRLILNESGLKDTIGEEALICIGLGNGELLIVSADRIVSRRRDCGLQIDAIQTSHNQVAIAQQNDIIFYSLDENNSLSKGGFAQRLDGKVKTIDFSTEEKFVLATLDNESFVICVVPTGEIIPSDDERVAKMRWNSFHCTSHSLTTQLEASCLSVSHSGRTVAVGDEQGCVRLYPFPPSSQGAQYYGHSDSIQAVCWTQNDEYCVTAGGEDHSLFIWKTSNE